MAKSKHRKRQKKRAPAAKKSRIGAPVDYASMFMPNNGNTVVGVSVSANLKRG